MDTTHTRTGDACANKKGRVFTRPPGTFPAPEVSGESLFRWLGRLGRRRLRGTSWLRSSRLWRRRRRSGYARLHVVGVHHCLGDVDRFSPPQHVALWPRLRGVDDHAEPVVLRILHDHGSHLLQDARGNLLVLVPEVFLRVLHGAVEDFLLAFDLLLQGSERLFIQLVLLSGELLL